MKKSDNLWSICVDTGGTFTDCIAVTPEGHRKRVKVLSSSALRGKIKERVDRRIYRVEQDWNAPDNFIRGFSFSLLRFPDVKTKVLSFKADESLVELEEPINRKKDLTGLSFEVKTSEEAPVLASRLVTATSADKKLPPITLRLATTKGTNALLENKGVPTALFVTEGYGDLLVIGTQQRPDLFSLKVEKPENIYKQVLQVPERLTAEGKVIKDIDLTVIEDKADELLQRGVKSAAVCLMHGYKNSVHEKQLEQWLIQKGFSHVSVSSELSPFIGIISRTETTLVNAYLAPVIQEYLNSVKGCIQGDAFIMTSAGGLTSAGSFNPKDSLLSGPAGGVVGAASEGKQLGFSKMISFDMGGTSTDVARFDEDYEYVFEHRVGNAHVVTPALNVETVAAGGGSVCYYDGHKLCVGPESAGAYPGPACYGAGGPLTITDINLLLGRLDQKNFHIPVAVEDAEQKLQEMVDAINENSEEQVSPESVLQSFLSIANERMTDAIQKISIRKGYDTSEYALVSFGGAGGQHACAIARRLKMQRIIIPDEAGLLSATGLGNAVIEEFAERQILAPLLAVRDTIDKTMDQLATRAISKLEKIAHRNSSDVKVRRKLLAMRFEGQETSLDIEYKSGQNIEQAFRESYIRQYGHWVRGRTIEVESARVVASAAYQNQEEFAEPERKAKPDPLFEKHVWFHGGRVKTPFFLREHLSAGDHIEGPALILDPYSTIVIEPCWNGVVYGNNSLVLKAVDFPRQVGHDAQPEAARLELFINRFSSVASEMGEMLQRTALSVNVKDRLDFSCALLSPEGELVVNAPHIPVHLGALGLCVRSLIETIEMRPGDVVITNHPANGGSHLPDVTVVTPMYTDDEELIGYAASRAHHAEIGGVHPGSMPPDATSLIEEGVVIPPMYLIEQGEEKWEYVKSHLQNARYPTRDIDENMADLQAAVAANHRGVQGLRSMVGKYGLDQVHHYMHVLKKHAEEKMRNTLERIPPGEYKSEECLDDGTPLRVKLAVSEDEVTIDFAGTGPVHPNNLNATPAIVNSVIMYFLRLMVDEPLPLNEGLLAPVTINLPGCLLNPEFHEDPARCPAVVGGNIEVSQRLVDTLLKPFNLMACSQGTMNNILFGNNHFGYYETVGGGTGAGPSFHGADAVHHHMTNTRGTDPEILEHRYPVRLNRYAVRKGSGGRGQFNGGNGIIRELTFLKPVRLTILTQHRSEKPYGLRGGEPGLPGEQWVWYGSGKKEKLRSVDGRDLNEGDQFILKTPGGGGFGKPD